MPRTARKKLPTSAVLADVDAALRNITVNRTSDPEAAHAERDKLYVFALRCVAAGHPYAADIAARALRATRIKLLWDATA